MKIFKNLKIAILLCLTLGIAPYFPEPHIIGKLRWIIGGAKGMKLLDWIDVVLHGAPFLLLAWIIILKIKKNAT